MKIICVGRNYASHAEELGNKVEKDPVIFFKPDTAVLKNGSVFHIPDFSADIHHEIEVIVRIKKSGKHISPDVAHKYFDRISLGIDFTARDIQNELKKSALPWEKAKAFDHSAAIGQWLPVNIFESIQDLPFYLQKNDRIVQEGNTSNMIHQIHDIISYVSSFTTLKVGDVIFTGTPSGVGPVQKGDILAGWIQDKHVLHVFID
jgi:2-keto-4-pentenoate hydratase/2-oxohepta-3-ene-1,7-dioic acid hydratase in catechol pathway